MLTATEVAYFRQTCERSLDSTFLPAGTASSWPSQSFHDPVERRISSYTTACVPVPLEPLERSIRAVKGEASISST